MNRRLFVAFACLFCATQAGAFGLGKLGRNFGSLGHLGGAGIPSWVQPGAIIDEDFANARYYPRPVATELVDTRTSNGYAADTSSNWSNFLATVLRITSSGYTNEPTDTNTIRNNSAQGAVAGTPGTPPTNWSIVNGNGIAVSIIGTGTESGIDYVDIRYFGTATATFGLITFFEATTQIAALTGQTWSLSTFLKLQAGSLTGLGAFNISIAERTSGGAGLGNHDNVITNPTNAALGTQRPGAVILLNGGATTAFIQPFFYFTVNNGGVVDITLRVGWPQLEQSGAVTTPIRTTSAAVTRATDATTIQRTGIGRVVFTFDDNSQQTISGISTGSQYTLPTNLNRAVIKRMTGYAS